MSKNSPSGDKNAGGAWLALGGLVLAVVCCAGPALLAGGGIAVAGGLLGTPLLLALAVLVLVGAVLYTVSGLRGRRRRAPAATAARATDAPADHCCDAPELPAPRQRR